MKKANLSIADLSFQFTLSQDLLIANWHTVNTQLHAEEFLAWSNQANLEYHDYTSWDNWCEAHLGPEIEPAFEEIKEVAYNEMHDVCFAFEWLFQQDAIDQVEFAQPEWLILESQVRVVIDYATERAKAAQKPTNVFRMVPRSAPRTSNCMSFSFSR